MESVQNNRLCSLLNHENAAPTRSLVILGVSGSVGGTTLEYLRENPEIKLAGLSVHSSVRKLRECLGSFQVSRAGISDPDVYDTEIAGLQSEFPEVDFFRGEEGLVEMIQVAHQGGADTVLTAVVGACGIKATFAALELDMKVALANKETLVTAGPAIENFLEKKLAASRKNRSLRAPVILPVDSEHNAIFQLLEGMPSRHVHRVILTASGGPFRDREAGEIKNVSRAEVLNHPTWAMGPKITVDSAGMINKGLEIIEAHFLFSLPYESLDVLIHKHSLVHGMVATVDGGYLFCGSHPNMVFPIAHSLLYPDPVPRRHAVATPPDEWPGLEFERVSAEKYPGFSVCMAAARAGGTGPAILNAANEVAVELFLDGQINFSDIPRLLADVLDKMEVEAGVELGLFLQADERARRLTRESLSAFR